MNRDQIIERIETNPKTHTADIIMWLKAMSIQGVKHNEEKFNVSKLLIGDVVTHNVSGKVRPCVIIGITGAIVFMIPLSTTEDEMNLGAFKHRILGDQFFSKGIITTHYNVAIKAYMCTFGVNKQLKEAIKLAKQSIIDF